MPAPIIYGEDNIDPFAADSTSVYAYPFLSTMGTPSMDFRFTNSTFLSLMDLPYDESESKSGPKLHQMTRSSKNRSRSNGDGWRPSSESSPSSSSMGTSFDGPIWDQP